MKVNNCLLIASLQPTNEMYELLIYQQTNSQVRVLGVGRKQIQNEKKDPIGSFVMYVSVQYSLGSKTVVTDLVSYMLWYVIPLITFEIAFKELGKPKMCLILVLVHPYSAFNDLIC